MQQPRLAGRYAKSLIDLATEKNQLEVIYTDVQYLRALCKASKDFLHLLRSPVIKADKKIAILKEVLSGKINPLTEAFIQLMARKGREGALPSITDSFIDMYNKLNGIQKVKLTTAIAVGDDLTSSISQRLQADMSFKKIDLESVVDESIIGGFQLEFDGKLLDASVARDLRDVSKQFQGNIYIADIR